MLAKKNRVFPAVQSVAALLTLILLVSGCTPAGPRAFLKGKKLLDSGDNAEAVAELKLATTLLATNAQAWNYYGVALQRAGQPADAASAYQRALVLDRDLIESHFNLGWLYLEQNRPDAAKNEFTAYTLRRPNEPAGWLKLASAQLRCGELAPAERSYSTALYLNTNNAEAYNGLGLINVQRGRPREASQFFSAAIYYHPDYAPAYLNLGTVCQQYLRDNSAALKYYKYYLTLDPHAANAGDITAIINDLSQPPAAPARAAAPSPAPTPAAPTITESKPAPTAVYRAFSPPRAATPVRPAAPPPELRTTTVPPAQVVQVAPEPEIVATPTQPETVVPSASRPPAVETPANVAASPKAGGFWQKVNPTHWFGGNQPEKKFDENGVTPLPSGTESSLPLLPLPPHQTVANTQPAKSVPPPGG